MRNSIFLAQKESVKKAFSLIELLFVIILLGILSFVAIPKIALNRDLENATNQLISHIRYTQHLAMIDDRFDPKVDKWFMERWRIRFKVLQGDFYYEIYSDRNKQGNSDTNEEALDPVNGLKLGDTNLEANPKINLTKSFNIKNISFSSNCDGSGFKYPLSSNRGGVLFDELGRVYEGVENNNKKPYKYLLTTRCIITLTHTSGKKACIAIEPITGYAHKIDCQ